MADVMGRCSQLPRASRFPLSMVDVIISRSKLLLASRFLPNIMVDVLNLRFPVNMVDVPFPLNMVEVMGSLGRLLLASRFLSSRGKLLWASHPNMVDVPLSMVDVMCRARELVWASRFLNIKLPLASRLAFNMVDALSLRFLVNMVDVLSRRSKLLLASRFPLNMVDGTGSLGRILLAHSFQVDVLRSRNKLLQEFVQLLLGTPAPCKLILQTLASLRRLSPSFQRAMAKW